MATTPTVIDISHYQSGLSLAAFKAAGGLAVIAKASQGVSVVDPEFATFEADAAAAGLAFASYHYLTTDPPAAQASFFLSVTKPLHGARICADWEAPGVTAADAVAFFQAVQAARPDLALTLYADAATANAAISTDVASAAWLSKNTSLWVAEYQAATPVYPMSVWTTWSLWQYSDSGSVAGYAGPVDLNEFNGSNANLLKWFGPAAGSASPPASTSAPAPAPAPAASATPLVTITIASDQPINLVVNGAKIALS